MQHLSALIFLFDLWTRITYWMRSIEYSLIEFVDARWILIIIIIYFHLNSSPLSSSLCLFALSHFILWLLRFDFVALTAYKRIVYTVQMSNIWNDLGRALIKTPFDEFYWDGREAIKILHTKREHDRGYNILWNDFCFFYPSFPVIPIESAISHKDKAWHVKPFKLYIVVPLFSLLLFDSIVMMFFVHDDGTNLLLLNAGMCWALIGEKLHAFFAVLRCET